MEIIKEFITTFDQLAIHTKNLSDEFYHNVSLMVLRRPFGNMFKGIIPLIGWRLVTDLLTLKLPSIPKTLVLFHHQEQTSTLE